MLILGPSGSGRVYPQLSVPMGIIPNIHKGQAQGQVRIAGQKSKRLSMISRS